MHKNQPWETRHSVLEYSGTLPADIHIIRNRDYQCFLKVLAIIIMFLFYTPKMFAPSARFLLSVILDFFYKSQFTVQIKITDFYEKKQYTLFPLQKLILGTKKDTYPSKNGIWIDILFSQSRSDRYRRYGRIPNRYLKKKNTAVQIVFIVIRAQICNK